MNHCTHAPQFSYHGGISCPRILFTLHTMTSPVLRKAIVSTRTVRSSLSDEDSKPSPRTHPGSGRQSSKPMSKPNPRTANGARRRALRARVLAAYDMCAICGKPVDKTLRTPHPLSPEVDEIIPVSRGGNPLDWNNCQLVHRQCNRQRSNHSMTWAKEHLHNSKPVIKPTSLPFKTSF